MGSIYTQGNYYAKDVSSPAIQLPLASVMHIGGETQDNVEDAIVALSENSSGNNIENLSDVNVDNPVEGDFLEYDGIANIWINYMQMPKIVTWANGTDEEIAAMLEAHYKQVIDITDYWTVGDERIVSLSAMAKTGVGESHVAQDVIMVLMNNGGKKLTTIINGHTECAFIVGQKNCLSEYGYMNSTNTNAGGWDQCARRTWCNSVYKNAFPSTLVNIFKEHQNITADGSGSTTTISRDYFALPSEKEVFGTTSLANSTAEANNKQFKYYETSNNRLKVRGISDVTYTYWWGRSPTNGVDTGFNAVEDDGDKAGIGAGSGNSIAPFGVI